MIGFFINALKLQETDQHVLVSEVIPLLSLLLREPHLVNANAVAFTVELSCQHNDSIISAILVLLNLETRFKNFGFCNMAHAEPVKRKIIIGSS